MVLKEIVRVGKLIWGLLFIFNLISCSSLFFYPDKRYYPNPLIDVIEKKDVYFESKDGIRLHGWYIFSKREKPKGVVVHFHGNAENISTYIGYVYWLLEDGYDVFMFDYRGYGKSEGKPSFKGIHEDGLSAIEKAYEIGRSKNLILFGQSLGGAVSIYCTANSEYKDSIKALIVDSPFADYRLIVRDRLRSFFLLYPFSLFVPWFFDNYYSPLKWVEEVKPVPIIFIHGKEDSVIPYTHTLLLSEKVDWKKYVFITDAEHIESLADPLLRKEILRILDDLTSG